MNKSMIMENEIYVVKFKNEKLGAIIGNGIYEWENMIAHPLENWRDDLTHMWINNEDIVEIYKVMGGIGQLFNDYREGVSPIENIMYVMLLDSL